MNPLLLCTDLDRTLLPNGRQPESPGARAAFARLAAHPAVQIIYVTGRNPGQVDEAIATWNVPVPDLLIADVGTTIATRDAGRWARWPDWDGKLSADWAGRSPDELRAILAPIAGLVLQPAPHQSRYKISWYAPAGPPGEDLAAEVRRRLTAAGVRANVIWSEDQGAERGLVDVLPAAASKRLALEFASEHLGYRPESTVFAGDSGNDLDVLTSPIPAVLVANADPAVRDDAMRRAAEAGHAARLHCARGGALGMNGNYAAGIIEGVLHYHPAWAGHLQGAS